MLWHICEDNLPSFFTAVFYAYYNAEKPDGISTDKNDVLLGDKMLEFETSLSLARRVRDGINRYSKTAYADIEYVFASNVRNRHNIIFKYIRRLFLARRNIDDLYSADPDVRAFGDIKFKVGHEINRLYGFIRLRELANGVMYAYFSSDHNVLELIAPHFASRFNTERLIIHDLKRGSAAICAGGEFKLTSLEQVEVEYSQEEDFYASLWRQYHENVSIDSRKNTRLQTGFMPRRYRWFMNENE